MGSPAGAPRNPIVPEGRYREENYRRDINTGSL